MTHRTRDQIVCNKCGNASPLFDVRAGLMSCKWPEGWERFNDDFHLCPDCVWEIYNRVRSTNLDRKEMLEELNDAWGLIDLEQRQHSTTYLQKAKQCINHVHHQIFGE